MLIYKSGFNSVIIPPQMGSPKEDQLCGTPLENLAELASRICYDSLGKGRSSVDFHNHIKEVKHFSVIEHSNITFEIKTNASEILLTHLVNKPGIWTSNDKGNFRITMNLRAIREFDKYDMYVEYVKNMKQALIQTAMPLAPLILGDLFDPNFNIENFQDKIRIVPPEDENEIWLSFYLSGSRNFSHEMVRHGDFTAISQRSTRYVDESESPYAWHPLLIEYKNTKDRDHPLHSDIIDHENASRVTYDTYVQDLEAYCINTKKMDKFTARKQARGAARGFLLMCLNTEMIFSANLRQWRHIHSMRCSNAADLEISQIIKALEKDLGIKNVSGTTSINAKGL
jgi:thymidylate synthase ThyX